MRRFIVFSITALALFLSGCSQYNEPNDNLINNESIAIEIIETIETVETVETVDAIEDVEDNNYANASEEDGLSYTYDIEEIPLSTSYIIETLAQSEWRGRLTGMEGNIAAGEFLAYAFARAGLSPFIKESFLRGFEQTVYDPDASAPRLTLALAGGTERELVFGEEFGVNVYAGSVEMTFAPGSQSPPIRPAQPMMLVHGYGSSSVLAGHPRSAGVLFRILSSVYEEVNWGHVEHISFSMYDSAETVTVYNIAGVLPGRDNTKAVVVGAHFDGAGYMGEMYTPGALDNASGVAAMLRAAANIAAWDEPPETDIIFVAFNGHENGLFGSNAFAEELVELGIYEEIYMISIDCVGFVGGQPIALDLSGSSQFLMDRNLNIALNQAIAYVMNEWGMDFVDFAHINDHYPFQVRGIPAANLTQNIQHGVHYIHTRYDTMDILDLDEIDRVGDLVSEIIFRIGADFSFAISEDESISERNAAHDANLSAIFLTVDMLRRVLG